MNLKDILNGQGWKQEEESQTAFFFNHAPWIAPLAYLHIVFKEADEFAVEEVGDALRLPRSLKELMRVQNGGIFYSGAMSLYGVHVPGALLDRKDFLNRLPFSIETENLVTPIDRDQYVAIGGYGTDGSKVFLDRTNESVVAISKKDKTILNDWPDARSWLTEELKRLSHLFDDTGKIKVPRIDTLPGRRN